MYPNVELIKPSSLKTWWYQLCWYYVESFSYLYVKQFNKFKTMTGLWTMSGAKNKIIIWHALSVLLEKHSCHNSKTVNIYMKNPSFSDKTQKEINVYSCIYKSIYGFKILCHYFSIFCLSSSLSNKNCL